jgi:hypothetical protein
MLPAPKAKKVTHASLRYAARVEKLVAEINAHSKDETVEDNVAVGKGLVKLFGGLRKTPGLVTLSKKDYPTLGLKVGYSWVRRMMRIGLNPIISNPIYAEFLPPAKTSLIELTHVWSDKLQRALTPDANGETVITSAWSRAECNRFRFSKVLTKDNQPKKDTGPTHVLILYPREDMADFMIKVRESGLSCKMVVARVDKHIKHGSNYGEDYWGLSEVSGTKASQ